MFECFILVFINLLVFFRILRFWLFADIILRLERLIKVLLSLVFWNVGFGFFFLFFICVVRVVVLLLDSWKVFSFFIFFEVFFRICRVEIDEDLRNCFGELFGVGGRDVDEEEEFFFLRKGFWYRLRLENELDFFSVKFCVGFVSKYLDILLDLISWEMFEYWVLVNCCLVIFVERLFFGLIFGLIFDDGSCGFVFILSIGGVGGRGTIEFIIERKGFRCIIKVFSINYRWKNLYFIFFYDSFLC